MTELLSLPLHAYVVLDTLYDDHLIDEGTYLVIMARMPHAAASALFDGMETYEQRQAHPRTGNITGKREFGAALNAMADSVIAGLDDDERRAVAELRLKWLGRQARDLAWFFAVTSFEDQTTGGALEPYLPAPRLHRDGRPFRKIWALIHSTAYIRAKIAAERESSDFAREAKRIMAAVANEPADTDLIDRWRQRIEEERCIAREQNDRRFWRDRNIDPLARYVMTPKMLAKRRRVLKRAFRTATRVLPAPDLSRFARGDSIRLEGRTIDLIIERGGGRLADLCLYIDGTPALDQLTGLALAMAAGEDEQVVRDANVIRLYPAGEQHPLLIGRSRARAVAMRDLDPVISIKDAYVERTKARWARELKRFAGVDELEIAA